MAWWKRGQKSQSVKKEVGETTGFPTTPTVSASTAPTGTQTEEQATSPLVPKSPWDNASQPDTSPQDTFPIKTDAPHGKSKNKKAGAMSRKLNTTITDETYAGLRQAAKNDETVNDTVRRILNKSLKISNK